MYYLAKISQASGLTVISVGFIKSFPNLLDRKLLMIGILLFAFGWIIQTFLLKN